MTSKSRTISYDSGCCFRSTARPATRRLLWEITTRCNLSCAFCHRTPGEGHDTPLRHCQAVIPFLRRSGFRGVILSGGEPLLRIDIFDAIDLLASEGLSVDMCTNGTLVTRDVATRLSRVLSEISVSIDSYSAAVHDSLRGRRGAWEATVSGIRVLQERGLQVHTISLTNSKTIEGIAGTVDFLAELGVSSMAFIGQIRTSSGAASRLSEQHRAS